MKIESFIRTTLLDWEGKNACKIVIADCDPGFLHYSPPTDIASTSVNQHTVLEYIDEHIDFLTGAIISGGEPAGIPDLYRFLKEIKKRDIQVRLDTFGLYPEPIDDLIGAKFADCICMYIPAPLNKKDYSAAVGKEIDMETVMRTLEIIQNSGVDSIFKTVAIPGIVDEDSVKEIAKNITFAKNYYILRNTSEKSNESYNETDIGNIGKSAKKFVRNVGIRDV